VALTAYEYDPEAVFLSVAANTVTGLVLAVYVNSDVSNPMIWKFLTLVPRFH
jgi:hypothetical protein